jgi:hypothetical protein
MLTIQGKSVAFWIFLAVSVAFAMRIAVRAPHTIDARLIILMTISVMFLGIFAGRQLALGSSRLTWLMLPGAVCATLLMTYVLSPANSFDAWLLLVMAANAGRTLECGACAPQLRFDVQK